MEKTKSGSLSDQAGALAATYRYEAKHCFQVERLALALFDQLASIPCLDPRARDLLRAAAILHDIGWIHGQVRHHKTARDMIIVDKTLSLSAKERRIVALVVRYHRKSLPQAQHKYFSQLDAAARKIVINLGAFLRLADGLDRSHTASVESVVCFTYLRCIAVRIQGARCSPVDIATARKKSDLMARAFGKKITITACGV